MNKKSLKLKKIKQTENSLSAFHCYWLDDKPTDGAKQRHRTVGQIPKKCKET